MTIHRNLIKSIQYSLLRRGSIEWFLLHLFGYVCLTSLPWLHRSIRLIIVESWQLCHMFWPLEQDLPCMVSLTSLFCVGSKSRNAITLQPVHSTAIFSPSVLASNRGDCIRRPSRSTAKAGLHGCCRYWRQIITKALPHHMRRAVMAAHTSYMPHVCISKPNMADTGW